MLRPASSDPRHSLACGCITLISASAFPLCVSLCPKFPLLLRMPVTLDFRVHLNPLWSHLNLTISTKTLLPNTVTITGSGWASILWGHTEPSRDCTSECNPGASDPTEHRHLPVPEACPSQLPRLGAHPMSTRQTHAQNPFGSSDSGGKGRTQKSMFKSCSRDG